MYKYIAILYMVACYFCSNLNASMLVSVTDLCAFSGEVVLCFILHLLG